MNLKILERIREVGYDLSQVDFLSRREWLGENQEMLVAWHNLMAELCKPDAKEKYPHIYAYITQGIERAPVLPHYYDEDGEIPFKGLGGVIEFGELPFFMIDVEALQQVSFRVMCTDIDFEDMISPDNLGLKTGIVNDHGEYKIYNAETKEYVSIEDLEWISVEEEERDSKTVSVVKIDREKMSSDDSKAYPLPPEGYEIVMRNVRGLGFSQFGVVNELGGGFKLPNKDGEEHTYIPFQMSLAKLLFLAAGIDEDNQRIDASHPLHGAKKELQALMRKDEKNLWHPDNLNPDKLMQYQLANIFKDNPDLFRQAKGVVDVFIKNWENHQKVNGGVYFNDAGEQMEILGNRDYLLGDEQAVAYYLMQSIRMAWYSSINPEVLINAMEMGLPSGLAPLTHQFLAAKLKAKHRIRLEDGSIVEKSFLNVWDELREELRDRTAGKSQDFMSFDDHGWVVSLDPELIERQNAGRVYDRRLLSRLGIAGIESWWGSELNLWYKQARGRVEVVEESAEPTVAPQLLDATAKV